MTKLQETSEKMANFDLPRYRNIRKMWTKIDIVIT